MTTLRRDIRPSGAVSLLAAERATPSDRSSINLAHAKETAMSETAPKFKIRDLSVMAYAQGFTLWHYRAGITPLAEMMARGFFDAASDMFAVGDMLMISGAFGGAMVCVASVAPGVVMAPLAGSGS